MTRSQSMNTAQVQNTNIYQFEIVTFKTEIYVVIIAVYIPK